MGQYGKVRVDNSGLVSLFVLILLLCVSLNFQPLMDAQNSGYPSMVDCLISFGGAIDVCNTCFFSLGTTDTAHNCC